jgi:hypothetical protein
VLRITIPTDILIELQQALRKAGSRECGGVMMGEHVGVNHFAVRKVTVQKPGSVATFVRNMGGIVRSINSFLRANGNDFKRFNYLGEWHSHPLFSVQPSGRDHTTMRDLATNQRVGANFLVLLIVRLHGNTLEGSVHTYLPDGTIHPSELKWESETVQ